jgi:hypothetical protein
MGVPSPAFERAIVLSEFVFDYATEEERMKIRGLNAMKLYRFPTSV